MIGRLWIALFVGMIILQMLLVTDGRSTWQKATGDVVVLCGVLAGAILTRRMLDHRRFAAAAIVFVGVLALDFGTALFTPIHSRPFLLPDADLVKDVLVIAVVVFVFWPRIAPYLKSHGASDINSAGNKI